MASYNFGWVSGEMVMAGVRLRPGGVNEVGMIAIRFGRGSEEDFAIDAI